MDVREPPAWASYLINTDLRTLYAIDHRICLSVCNELLCNCSRDRPLSVCFSVDPSSPFSSSSSFSSASSASSSPSSFASGGQILLVDETTAKDADGCGKRRPERSQSQWERYYSRLRLKPHPGIHTDMYTKYTSTPSPLLSPCLATPWSPSPTTTLSLPLPWSHQQSRAAPAIRGKGRERKWSRVAAGRVGPWGNQVVYCVKYSLY